MIPAGTRLLANGPVDLKVVVCHFWRTKGTLAADKARVKMASPATTGLQPEAVEAKH